MRAMVLCAGFGTRLGDLTREIPKPMLPLCGRPMLHYILANLRRHGFNRIALNLHFMPETIRDHFGDGSRYGLAIDYSYEPQLLGTAGGTKNMEAFLRGSEPFLVHYGDVITNQDLSAMLEFHRSRDAIATLLVHERARSNSALAVAADGRIERFLERPTDDEWNSVQTARVFSGVTICSSEILDRIPPNKPCDFPRNIFVPLAAGGRLFACGLTGERVAVDSPGRLEEARRGVTDGHFSVD